MYGDEEECIKEFSGKARRKETIKRTCTQVGIKC
jgi:hypothetical protein